MLSASSHGGVTALWRRGNQILSGCRGTSRSQPVGSGGPGPSTPPRKPRPRSDSPERPARISVGKAAAPTNPHFSSASSMTHRVLVFLLFAIFLLRPSGAQPAVVPSAAGVDSILTARYESGAFHGAALVAQGDTVVYARGFGEANRKKGTPNTPDTQYLIGSLTKQFTAALVLTLVRDGLVRLDAPITRYLPNYTGEGGDRITIHHLLAHRSGLPSFADVRAAAGGSEEAVPLHGTPGTQYAYSNAGYILLGVIVEAVTAPRLPRRARGAPGARAQARRSCWRRWEARRRPLGRPARHRIRRRVVEVGGPTGRPSGSGRTVRSGNALRHPSGAAPLDTGPA